MDEIILREKTDMQDAYDNPSESYYYSPELQQSPTENDNEEDTYWSRNFGSRRAQPDDPYQ